MTLYIPVPPGTTTARLVAVVRPGVVVAGCATLPAYADKWSCARAHPGCVPWPVQVQVPS